MICDSDISLILRSLCTDEELLKIAMMYIALYEELGEPSLAMQAHQILITLKGE